LFDGLIVGCQRLVCNNQTILLNLRCYLIGNSVLTTTIFLLFHLTTDLSAY